MTVRAERIERENGSQIDNLPLTTPKTPRSVLPNQQDIQSTSLNPATILAEMPFGEINALIMMLVSRTTRLTRRSPNSDQQSGQGRAMPSLRL